jgi:glycosyltransferase involved in cell wall biosynthesis
VTLLVNVLAPYRLPLYRALASQFDLTLLVTGVEENRRGWQVRAEDVGNATIVRCPGWVIRSRSRQRSGVYEEHYLHVNPRLLRRLWMTDPDAVISNEMGFRSLVALLYGTLRRRPVWVWWGGTIHTERNVGAGRKLLRRLMSVWARRWLSYGATSTEYLRSIGVPASGIVELQNCVDETRFLETVRPKPRSHPVVACIGRLVGLKGVDLLLRAAAVLRSEGLTFELMIVGDGPERRRLEEQAAALQLQDVVWLGEVEASMMPQIYAASDLVVLPTLEDVWGLVVNEALWAGCSVLASKYAGCSVELLPPERIFDPLEATDLQDALRRGLRGQLPPVDRSPLLRARQVASRLTSAVASSLRSEEVART